MQDEIEMNQAIKHVNQFDWTTWHGKCGEEHGQFYDRKGDYFRKGVDPRNHYGRFVHRGCEYKRQFKKVAPNA